MPQAAERTRETTLNLRIDAVLKAQFAAVLRGLMRGYVEDWQRRRFAAEARRQSKLIADSEDEAEVMRWIQDVSAK